MGLVIFAAFVGVPIVEIAVFIEVGGWIGLFPTLGLIVLTALVGTLLLRLQGLATLNRARETLDRGELPVHELLDGICLLIAGALLLTPGFVTDATGAALLVPPLRHLLQHWVLQRLRTSGRFTVSTHTSRPGGDATIIEGEFHEVDDDEPPGDQKRLP